MPFKSKQQMKYMYLLQPEMARKWAAEQKENQGKGSFKKLPKRVKKRKR